MQVDEEPLELVTRKSEERDEPSSSTSPSTSSSPLRTKAACKAYDEPLDVSIQRKQEERHSVDEVEQPRQWSPTSSYPVAFQRMRLPLLGGRGLGESPRGLLHHHDSSHPVDPEPCVRRLRQELRSLAGEVLPWSETELPGAKQLQAVQRQGAARRVFEDVHLCPLSEPVPLAQ